ncbi:MAG: GNAT family N-acetyltransferase [Cohaesibacteraceae bacterium]
MTERRLVALTIEPLEFENHDPAAFLCGVEQVDNFLKKTAGKLTRADNTRVYVLADPAGAIRDFYVINALAINYEDMPKRFAGTRPAQGALPAAFLSMIEVDHRHVGQGYDGDLLADALVRIASAAHRLAIAMAILDLPDEGDTDAVEHRSAPSTR